MPGSTARSPSRSSRTLRLRSSPSSGRSRPGRRFGSPTWAASPTRPRAPTCWSRRSSLPSSGSRGSAVTLAGPGEPPPAAAALLAAQPGLGWLGWLGAEEKDRLLRESSVFVMSSLSEGLPMALLEAMAYGMAVVATAVGGIPEVVDDGVDGLLVEAGSSRRIADALLRLAGDPALRERLGAAARRAGRAARRRRGRRSPGEALRAARGLSGPVVLPTEQGGPHPGRELQLAGPRRPASGSRAEQAGQLVDVPDRDRRCLPRPGPGSAPPGARRRARRGRGGAARPAARGPRGSRRGCCRPRRG